MGPSRFKTASLCLQAITAADVAFAWIESSDCHGTLFELGYAVAVGRPVIAATPSWIGGAIEEMWFAMAMAQGHNSPRVCGADDPRSALREWLVLAGHLADATTSYVYFIEAVGLDRIKIGKSQNPDNRLATLQTGSPVPLKLLGKTPGGLSLEGKLHSEFSNSQIDREWFHATRELRDYIEGLAHAG